MKTTPLKTAMFAWNHGDGEGCHKPAGFVGVCTHPDGGQLPRTDYWNAPLFSFREKIPAKEAQDRCWQLKMMVEAWHMACRDAVPLENIHAAFMAIPEYRKLLSEDFRVHPQTDASA